MLKLAADENLNGDIVRGLRRRRPDLDVIRVQDAGLSGADDPAVLAWAASPYLFDFLVLGDQAQERDIERAMVRQIRDTLVEMGAGFAFVGEQVRLEVAGDEFFVDLLFYHLKLHCYVVVELKAAEFRPEHAGQLNFYLSAVDDLVRRAEVDGPTIGLLLCRAKNRVVAEYALRDIHKPIGVADMRLTRLLPSRLEGSLPTVEALEAELAGLAAPAPAGIESDRDEDAPE